VVSETLGANAGLGYLIALEGSSFRMANVYAALLLLAFEGVLMYAVFAWIEQHFTKWAFRSQMNVA
ncbi:MAG: ABC transporter permease, partial [Tardiphaga sp.]|nr:ABC transporter permease [Tardiphaga sp.]